MPNRTPIFFLTTICLLFYFNTTTEAFEMTSRSIKLIINTDLNSNNFGTVKHFNKNSDFGTWFSLRAGDKKHQNRVINYASADSVSLTLSDFPTLPLIAEYIYKKTAKGIIFELKCYVTDTCKFQNGLSLGIRSNYKYVASNNKDCQARNYNVSDSPKTDIHLDTYLKFHNIDYQGVMFFINNPFHSLWKLNANGTGKHDLELLQTVRPQGPYDDKIEGPFAFSTITPKDTIFRRIEIVPIGEEFIPLSLSEHPNGFTQTVTMHWDELPTWGDFSFMTTKDDHTVPYDHYFLRLLEEFPKMKMGYLFILDRISNRHYAKFDNWEVNSVYIMPDSLEKNHKNWCVLLQANNHETLNVSQKIPCSPNGSYTLSYNIKTLSLKGEGASINITNSSQSIISSTQSTKSDLGWRNHSINFQTDSNCNDIWIHLILKNSTGMAFFDNIHLNKKSTNENLIKNGSFETNQPNYVYDNKRRHWVDAHYRIHLASKATKEYLAFQRRIEQDSLKYGWEDRVRLGCHGYHHTPSLHEPDSIPPGWEFQYYDEENDKIRMEKIFEDTYKIGLTKKSMRFWRSPGFRHTSSLINLLIDSGFVFMDAGGIRRFPDFYYFRLQKGTNKMMGVNDVWWSDVSDNISTDRYFKTLSCGHIGQIGGHPGATFCSDGEKNYKRMENFFKTTENKFPNIGYVFPDEYADNALGIYDIKINNIIKEQDNVICLFKGKLQKGMTFAFNGTCSKATIDCKSTNLKVFNDITYIVVNENNSINKNHKLQLSNARITIEKPQSNQDIKYNTIFNLQTQNYSQVTMTVFNTRGQKLTNQMIICSNKNIIEKLYDLKLSRGIYFAVLESANKKRVLKLSNFNNRISFKVINAK